MLAIVVGLALFLGFIIFQGILVYIYRDVVFGNNEAQIPKPSYGEVVQIPRRHGTVDEPNFYKKLEEEYGHIECD